MIEIAHCCPHCETNLVIEFATYTVVKNLSIPKETFVACPNDCNIYDEVNK